MAGNELIVVSIIILIGQVILMWMWQQNWFKKENFKIQKSNVMAQNKLQIRKMEKELGLTNVKSSVAPPELPPLGGIGQLLPLLKGLDGDQLSGLIDKFVPGSEERSSGPIDTLLEFAEDNPEMVQGLLKGLTGGAKDGETQQQTQV